MSKELKIQIKKSNFNDVYLPYLDNEDRYLILYGGGSSGKSFFIGERYIIYRGLKQKMNLLVVRNTADSNRKSTFALLKQIIKKANLSNVWKTTEDLRIRNKINGNEIVFCGLDDVEKLKSITFENGECTDIWVEEATECTEADINQLKIRLRGGTSKKQMVLSFNPVDLNHWIKKHFIDSGLATVLHTTYRDNRFLTEEDKQVLESFKDTDPYYYDVYGLGKWGVLGDSYFDKQKIQKRLNELKEPLKTGYFKYKLNENTISDIEWIYDDTGCIKIYKEVEKGHYYVLGGDTAGEGSDNFTGQVLDNFNAKEMAVLKQKFDEDEYARQIYCLGMYFNTALIGLEINFSTYPTKKLQEYKYPKMYLRNIEDRVSTDVQDKFGFRTDRVTRPILFGILKEVFRDHIDTINDKDTLEEALTFVRNDKGRLEAQQGSHDDLLFGLGIAHYIRPQQKFTIDKKEEKIVELPFELRDDEENDNLIIGW